MQGRNSRDRSESVATSPKLVRVGEVARELSMSTRSVWRMIASGDLKAVRLGRSVRVVRTSIDALCERAGGL